MNRTKVLGLDEYGSAAELAAVKLFEGYSEKLLHFAVACCILFMVVGIPGNLITILALARYKKIRNATAYFIINLSCADLLFCCLILPLNVTIFLRRSWTHGILLCRWYSLTNYGLTATAIFTIVMITIHRYVMVVHPDIYSKLYQKRNILLMVIGIWVFAFGMLMPTFFEIWGRFSVDPTAGFCTVISDERNRSPKTLLVVMAFAFPITFMVFCYARILWIVRESKKKSKSTRRHVNNTSSDIEMGKDQDLSQEKVSSISACSTLEDSGNNHSKNKTDVSKAVRIIRNNFKATFRQARKGPTKKDKRLLQLILAIVITFFACHLPIMTAKVLNSGPEMTIVGYVLIYLTTCINPVVYVVMSKEYRQAYKKILSG